MVCVYVCVCSGQMLVTMTDDGGLFGYAQAGTRRFRMEGSKDATKITEIDTDAYGRTLHSVRKHGVSRREGEGRG